MRLTRLRPLLSFALALGAAAIVGAQTPPPATPARSAPTRPASTPAAAAPKALKLTEIFLRGTAYVDVREVATQLGGKASWSTPGAKLTLAAGDTRIVFQRDERDCYVDGVRVFLSEHVAPLRESLWVARVDFEKTLAPLLRPADYVAALPTPPRTIVLDAGHGGTDPGKSNARLRLNEKDMTLDVVLRLRKILEARGYRVLLTRKDDTRFSSNPIVDLQRRADFANKANADLFLSIHFNAVDPKEAQRVSGTETYVLTPRGMLSTSDERKDDLTDSAFPGHRADLPNVLLGFHLHRQLIGDLKTSDRGYKRARFAVLRLVDCPAALIESAYLSNDEEAARVARPEFRQQIAESIARGVASYSAALQALRAPAKQGG